MGLKKRRQKNISLKEAADLSGYASDYIGYLIRQGKIPGKRIYSQPTWVTTKEAIKEYKAGKANEKGRKGILIRNISTLEKNKKKTRETSGTNKTKRKKILAFSWRAILAAFLIVCLITGFAPIRFIRDSIRALSKETKVVNLYSQNCLGDWQNPENVQGKPEIGPGEGIVSFSEVNSAVYKNGSSYLICQDFVREDQQITEPMIELPEVEPLQSLPVEEGTTTEEIEEGTTTEEVEEEKTANKEILFATTETTTIEIAAATTTEAINELQEGTSSQSEETFSTGTEVLINEEVSIPSFQETEEPSENLEPLIQKETERFKSAKIKLSFAIGEKEPDIPPVEQTTSTQSQSTSSDLDTTPAPESSQEPISFWNRIKNFFGNSVVRAEEENVEENVEEAEEEPEEPEEEAEEPEEEAEEDILNLEEIPETEPLIEETTTETIIPEATTTDETLPEATTSTETTTTDEIIDEQEEDSSIKDAPVATTEILLDLDTRIVIWYSLDGEIWWELGSVFGYPLSNVLNDGYFEYEAPFLKNWEDVKNLKIKFEGVTEEGTNITTFLDSVWVEVTNEEQKKIEESEISLLSFEKAFKGDEEPEFRFRYKKGSPGILASIIGVTGLTDSWKGINVTAEVRDYQGSRLSTFTVSPELVFENNEEFSIRLHKFSRQFKPGKYKLIVKIENWAGSPQVVELEQDFTWGVLAINANKSIYLPSEWAYLQMAALEDDGHTICDADLALAITTPSNKVVNLEVERSGECGPDNVVDVPDYSTYYQVEGRGVYQMRLVNLDSGYEIADSFEVRNSVPFDIERFGPTRIYPFADYQMTIRIKANQDFKGEVREYVPDSFVIKGQSNPNFPSSDGKVIIWQVDWKAGETHEFSYEFDAPNISPYIYLLGPLELSQVSAPNFQEVRQWQIASDSLVTLRPNANGYLMEWTASTSDGNASNTSDQSDLTYVVASNSAAVGFLEFYHLDDPTFNQNATITSVTGYYRCRVFGSSGGPEKIDLMLRPTTTNEVTNANQAVNKNVFAVATATTQTTNPQTSLAWTYDDITYLQIGMEVAALGNNEIIQCSELYVVVDYTEPAANQAPSISNVTLNAGANINLVENDATTVSATATITDVDTPTDISEVWGKLFWSGATNATSCSPNVNDCTATTTCATTTACIGNDCIFNCDFRLWFPATSTDNDAATTWDCYMKVFDSQSNADGATNTTQGIEVVTLAALDVATSVDYGILGINEKNDPLDRAVRATTTGNTPIDANISGNHMCTDYPTCTVSTSIAYQQYATAAAVAYDGAAAWVATTGPTLLEFDTVKPTATPSDQGQGIWWGTLVPTSTAVGNYTGVNTLTAVTD